MHFLLTDNARGEFLHFAFGVAFNSEVLDFLYVSSCIHNIYMHLSFDLKPASSNLSNYHLLQDHVWIENSFSAVETQVPPSDLSGPTSDWNLSSSSIGYPGERPPYTCSICNKQVKLLRDLRAHMTAKHNLEQGFECHVCGSTSTYKHNLLRHLRTVHGIKLGSA